MYDNIVLEERQGPREKISAALTPFGAERRLLRDLDYDKLSTPEALMLFVLAAFAEKRTGEVRERLSRIAEAAKCGCERTARRRLQHLDSLGFLTYLPGRGRGRFSRVILLHETWGKGMVARMEKGTEKGTPGCPLCVTGCQRREMPTGRESGDQGRENTASFPPVPPFLVPTDLAAPPTPTNADIALEIAREFWEWRRKPSERPFDMLHWGAIDQERRKVSTLIHTHGVERVRQAFALVKERYGEKRPANVGMLGYFCTDYEKIKREGRRAEERRRRDDADARWRKTRPYKVLDRTDPELIASLYRQLRKRTEERERKKREEARDGG